MNKVVEVESEMEIVKHTHNKSFDYSFSLAYNSSLKALVPEHQMMHSLFSSNVIFHNDAPPLYAPLWDDEDEPMAG